ncbi:hypothetical protein IHQ68_04425 [Chelatococcus sambhunathii]|uniref:CopG family transcriptional regulator n=1 Tax=Chelatococcus sambhunathii TaxID=363953 RepID=A0ABU1DCT0_9HYPH|nr:hypothetical protein [Chelatococcus sambhunathii]MDR4305871.1 hypothetical protein [Chelatococcus sambhunathii]
MIDRPTRRQLTRVEIASQVVANARLAGQAASDQTRTELEAWIRDGGEEPEGETTEPGYDAAAIEVLRGMPEGRRRPR